MKLIDDFNKCHKFGTVRLLALVAIFCEVWSTSPDLLAMLPPESVAKFSPFVAVILIIVRVLDFERNKTN